MSKLTLNDVTSGYASTTAVNANNALIEAAFENTLSRDGTLPNSMLADLDMNGNLILNSGNAVQVSGFTWEGPWITTRSYQVGDIVEFDGAAYMAIVAHTSGVFATDLAAAKWQLFAAGALPTQVANGGKFLQTDGSTSSWQVPKGSEVSNTPTGTVAATTVQGAIDEIVSDLAAPSGSSLVGFIHPGTGAVARTVQDKGREVVSVKDFGAVGDGVTNDTVAIQSAIDAIPASGGAVFLPAGVYNLTATLTITNKAITLHGEGAGVSILKWTSLVTAGISATFNNIVTTLHMRNLSLRTNVANGGTAVSATWPITASWSKVTAVFESLEIAPESSTSAYWTDGIILDYGWNAIIRNVGIRGQDNSRLMNNAITLKGRSNDVFISEVHVYFCVTGLYVTGLAEGTLIQQSVIIFVTNGVLSDSTPPWLSVIGNHISSFAGGVVATGKSQVYVKNNLLYKRGESTLNYVGVQLQTADHCSVVNNNFFVDGAATGTADGIVIVSGSFHYIVGNIAQSAMGTLVWLQAGAASYSVLGNRHTATGTTVLAQGGGTNILRDNLPMDGITTLTANSVTPSVNNAQEDMFQTANTVATTITNLLDGRTGQIVSIVANDVNTTIQHNVDISLQGGVNFAMGNGAILTLRKDPTVWREVSRRTA